VLSELSKEEWFESQYGEVKHRIDDILPIMPYRYFCGYSFHGKNKGNLISGMGIIRSHSIHVAKTHRCHVMPFIAWQDEPKRFHFHSILCTDTELHLPVLRREWRKHGKGKFEEYDPELHGDKYIFLNHFYEDGFYPFCGNNKRPCSTKKGNRCIHGHKLRGSQLQ
jgi:hypothetical protein